MCKTCGCEAASSPVMVPVPGEVETLTLERDVLAANRRIADHCRQHFDAARVLAVNLVSSPGSGKTSLLEHLIPLLAPLPVAAIAGDVETELDAGRLARLGIPAVAIETRGGCHLTARHVHDAVDNLTLPRGGILFIENVGNLVCPADFDLGEHFMMVLLSAAEGHDKPAKYPAAFRRANVVVLSKSDLATACDFDRVTCRESLARLNPSCAVIETSVRTGAGLPELVADLTARRLAVFPC